MKDHENKGKGIITIDDDKGVRHTFIPGQIITLNRIYHKFEPYGIFPLKTIRKEENKKSVFIEKPIQKIKEKQTESEE